MHLRFWKELFFALLSKLLTQQHHLQLKYHRTMVYAGKPSAGCENCRYAMPSPFPSQPYHIKPPLTNPSQSSKAKKRCDQGNPRCERCTRLGKPCGGYRDLNDLIFKDETSSTARRAGSGT